MNATPIRHIVVGSDLSERSDRALARALAIARQHGASLEVAAVIDEELPGEVAETVAGSARQTLRDRIAAHGGGEGGGVETQVLRGQPHVALAERARGGDLLVLGPHRHDFLEDLVNSTTLERIVRACDTPVLVVRDPVEGDYGSVLASIDFSPASANALRTAARLCPDAEISLFHAFHVVRARGEGSELPFRREAEARMEAFLEANGLRDMAPAHIAAGSLQAVLHARMEALRPDLLALGAHGRSALMDTLLGGFALELMREPPCDLLLAPGATPSA